MPPSDLKTPAGVVIFDLDGTLVDTSEDIAFSVNYMRGLTGQSPLSTEEVLTAVGRGAPHLLGVVLGIDPADRETMTRRLGQFQEHYLAHQGERSHLYPGIRETLEALSTRYDLYVLSNKPTAATRREVEIGEIDALFKEVWGAGALPGLKPDPLGVLRAVQMSNLSRSQAVMVGDLSVDIETGYNAGVSTCFVTWGFGTAPTSPRPNAMVGSPADLVGAIDGMIG